jgi:hypothetical protein
VCFGGTEGGLLSSSALYLRSIADSGFLTIDACGRFLNCLAGSPADPAFVGRLQGPSSQYI